MTDDMEGRIFLEKTLDSNLLMQIWQPYINKDYYLFKIGENGLILHKDDLTSFRDVITEVINKENLNDN